MEKVRFEVIYQLNNSLKLVIFTIIITFDMKIEARSENYIAVCGKVSVLKEGNKL